MFRKTLHAAAIFVAAAVVGVALAGGSRAARPVAHAQPPADPPAPHLLASQFGATIADTGLQKTTKISPILDKLARIDAVRRAAGQGAVTAATAGQLTPDINGLVAAKRMRIDDAGRVAVWVRTAGSPSGVVQSLVARGMQVRRTDDAQSIVQGLLPINQLQSVSALAAVATVTLPDYGFVQTGSVNTQGDTILGTADLRSKLTAAGAGVRVGIISDGMEGLATSQGSSDLGAVDTTTCNVASGQPSPTASGAGAEGTAMAEIVHDLAPGAQLMFGYFGLGVLGSGSSLDFNAAVNCLAAHNDVVVDDVGWFVGPYDGTSTVSTNTSNALNNLANPIRGYYTAVANMAVTHYESPFVNSGFTLSDGGMNVPIHQLQAVGGTTDAGFGVTCSPGVFCGNTFAVPPGGTGGVILEWNDPFGAASDDYDMFLFDFTNPAQPLVSAGANPQTGSQDPMETVFVQNTDIIPHTYGFVIVKFAGLAKTLNAFLLCSQGCFSFPNGTELNFNTVAGSVPNQGDATGGVVSVGAISAANSPNFNTIEPYSSRGPTADARTKPDITGIDCVAITGAAGFFNPFCGTSAAAPHIAGIAALLLSCNPTLLAGKTGSLATGTARNNLRTALLNGAVDLGAAGADNTFGAGRANTTNSAPLAGCVDTDGDGYPDGLETTLGENPASFCATMRADLNGDGRVNIVDLSAAVLFYNQNVPPAPPRNDQGVAPDGKINIIDLSAMAGRFNQFVTSCP